MGIKNKTSINKKHNIHDKQILTPTEKEKTNSSLCLWTGQDQHGGEKRKGRARLASTYRNNTGANAELTMG